MSMFNDYQRDWMECLSRMPREDKCRCGWDRKGECYNCNHADFRRLGVTHDDQIRRHWETWISTPVRVLDYRLPNGCMTGYQGAVEWLKRQERDR